MLLMIFPRTAIYQNVIKKHQYKILKVPFKNVVHQRLKGGWHWSARMASQETHNAHDECGRKFSKCQEDGPIFDDNRSANPI